MAKKNSKPNLTAEDFEFVSNIRSSVLIKSPKSTQRVLMVIAVLVLWLIIWSNFAEVDEITRGNGKVIPSGQLQMIQNLEGGIIKKILVKEGDKVVVGQPLLHIENTKFLSEYEANEAKVDELTAKEMRLNAQSHGLPFVEVLKSPTKHMLEAIKNERSLYVSNKKQFLSQIKILEEQLSQKRNELERQRSKLEHLRKSYTLLKREINIQLPLAESGVISEVEIIKLERDASKELEEISSVKLSIPGMESEISEIQSKISEAQFDFQNKAKKEWNEVNAEIIRYKKEQDHLKDQVSRTAVSSPVEGTVNQIFINTKGGVVKPGMDLIEIVPSEDILLVEAKIKPQDIAFLFPGQKAIVKFSAYDFSIYGGLEGEVNHISADTITDEEGESYYLVRIKTDETSLKSVKGDLNIIPGMTTSVDILTGKKTIMDYLLKPIFKAKNSALSER